MAHYAFLNEKNIVVQVIAGRDEDEVVDGVSDWEAYYSEVTGFSVLRTSYNTRAGVHYDSETGLPSEDQSKAFRKNYAGKGFSYDPDRDAFVPKQPDDSWTFNEETCQWDCPPELLPPEDQE